MLTKTPAEPPLRRSTRPAKQLMFMWLYRDMLASAGFRDGLDVACAEMNFRPLFRTQTYTGVDIDAPRLAKGATKYPEANAVVGSIEELNQTGDFVLCVQTIGFNQLFDPGNTMLAISKLIAATRPGGTLIFNIGRSCQAHRKEIDAMLAASFATVRAEEYGALNFEIPKFVSKPLAQTMNAFPTLRGSELTYFRCADRRL